MLKLMNAMASWLRLMRWAHCVVIKLPKAMSTIIGLAAIQFPLLLSIVWERRHPGGFGGASRLSEPARSRRSQDANNKPKKRISSVHKETVLDLADTLRLRQCTKYLALSLVAIIALLLFPLAGSAENAMKPGDWRSLKQGINLCGDRTVRYFEFQTLNGSKASLIVAKAHSNAFRLKPYLNNPTCPTSAAAELNKAIAAVNGGYFNLSNGESTSYIVIDGKQVCGPKTNLALINNPKLKPYLDVIFNRSEIRFLNDREGRKIIRFARHYDALPNGTTLIDSMQSGPMLLPRITAKEEVFIRTDPDGKEVDSIGSRKTAARTAFGITLDGYVMMLCVSGKSQDEFSSGITLERLASLMKQLGCVQAMNLDGGASTTMVILNKVGKEGDDISNYKVVCGRVPETRVKSVLLLLPTDMCGYSK